ncbi:transmembrane protein C16orf54 homolog isoform X1 [Sus scrofa]|nr:transmembrane protein C16orf54 homolog isoform X1 [Sus scrofa]
MLGRAGNGGSQFLTQQLPLLRRPEGAEMVGVGPAGGGTKTLGPLDVCLRHPGIWEDRAASGTGLRMPSRRAWLQTQMPPTPEQPSGPMEEPLALAASSWPPLPCGPCVPIMLVLAALAAVFLLTTAVLAERLFRRSLRPDPGTLAPTLVWRPGGELWIEPTGTPRERSEDWYGSSVPLLMDRAPDPPTLGGTLEARATAPPAPNSPRNSLVPQTPPQAPARSTFWRPQVWEERPHAPGLVSWAEPEQRPEASGYLGSPQARRQRPGSPDPEWGLQPRVTLEEISAFWRREGRTSVGF